MCSRTFMRVFMELSAKSSIRNQCFTLQTPGIKAKAILGIHIAGLNGPNKPIAERRYNAASDHFLLFKVPKFWLNPKSPIESKANQYIRSLMTIVPGMLSAMALSSSCTWTLIFSKYLFSAFTGKRRTMTTQSYTNRSYSALDPMFFCAPHAPSYPL
jgi:hypothetical protein